MMDLGELKALELVFVEDDESGQLKATCEAGVQYWLVGRRMTIAYDGHSVNETLPDGYEPTIKHSRKRLKSKLLGALTQLTYDLVKTSEMLGQYERHSGCNARILQSTARVAQESINEIILGHY